ncbi:hypothetical protein OT109_13730 [Phycisphaeraceae bacterium D3-23]
MRRTTHALVTALCCTALLGTGASAIAQDTPGETPDAPVTPPPTGQPAEQPAQTPEQTPEQPGLIVHDLVIMQADLFGQKMNDPGDFDTTLFNGAPRRRDVGENSSDTPMPLGLITLGGAVTQPTSLRIDIAGEDGQFLGHWPKGVASRDYLVWYDIQQADTLAGRMRVDPDHWLAPLRDGEGPLPFNSRGQIDRFFCYDATFAFRPTLKVEGKQEEGYTIAGEPPAGTQHILVVRRDSAGWRMGTLSAAPFAGPIEMQQISDADEAVAPILEALRQRGYPETQAATAAAILRETAFGDASMSLIYLVNEETLDTLLPLTIAPEPATLHRLGIVVLNNVEPDIAGTVGELIAQLGDDDWARRNAAQRALIEMDRAAIGVVRDNASHADPEVAYRVEQIIAAYEQRHD